MERVIHALLTCRVILQLKSELSKRGALVDSAPATLTKPSDPMVCTSESLEVDDTRKE